MNEHDRQLTLYDELDDRLTWDEWVQSLPLDPGETPIYEDVADLNERLD